MAHLAIVGSHAVNGVAELHSRLLKTRVFKDFYELWPHIFQNKTNGVTQRRWLLLANPGLARLLDRTIGDRWVTDLEGLRRLEEHANDTGFLDEFRRVKQENKTRLSRLVSELTGVEVDPSSLFDIKRSGSTSINANYCIVLFVVHEYLSLVEDGRRPQVPRTHIFAGKAAPGYLAAKLVIKLVHNVANVINNDRRCRDALKVAFLPDYRVSLAERVIPAADLERADLHRRDGGVGDGEHEVRDERRPHDGDLRRRQHRDPRGGRRR